MSAQQPKKYIESLTAEQEAQLAVYTKKGIEMGLVTGPFDEEKAKDYGRRIMELLGRPYTETIIVDSPLAACKLAAEILRKTDPTVEYEPVWPFLDGHYMSFYVQWYNYYTEVLGLELPDAWPFLEQVEYGPVYPLEDTVLISRRPIFIGRNESGLHADGRMALEYPDGFGCWSLNNVDVPEWLVMTPDSEIDPKRFAEISNVEVRREFVRKVGIERISQVCGQEVLDKQGDYELLAIDLGGDVGVWPYLKMKNPSIDAWHLECVDRDIKTVAAALEWRNQSSIRPDILT